jgi:exopolyphosphatase/guanosine-5'-triphosphate,3'-diphosphate pyrophosphatase
VVVDMQVDAEGTVVAAEIYRGALLNRAKLTYDGVSAWLAGAAPLSQIAADTADRTLTLVGVAGTVTTLKALELGLPAYDAARVHGSRLSLATVEGLFAQLSALPLAERVKLPGLEPKRADVIVVGALIVRELLRRAGATETVVSDRGVRFGLLEALISA